MKNLYSNILLLSLLYVINAQATSFDDIGYTKLKAELGVDLPKGAGVNVTHVEAPIASLAWDPAVTDPQFVGKTINIKTPGSNGDSTHATAVGKLFYGLTQSSSPGILFIDAFEVNDWLGSGFLNNGGAASVTATTRVANHSWVGDAGSVAVNVDILRRLDSIIDADEFIQAVASNSTPDTTHLLTDSFNAISVRVLKNAGSLSAFLNGTYTNGRSRTVITAPESTLSGATPRIASAAALLIGLGHSDTSLSTDPSVLSITTTGNGTVYNAERSETIKAVLMAGADRNTLGNTSPPAAPVDITDYRSAGNLTSNGLDARFGAGQLNIYNSYHILNAKEQNSVEDLPANSGAILNKGFDYDPAFGGQGGSNSTATYNFSTNGNPGQKLKADLVWNLEVATPNDKLHDLGLQLIDVTGGSVIVASSNSSIDNTENIWFDLLSNRSYRMEVIVDSGSPFNWDYALAWQIVVPGITVVETAGATVTEEAGTTTDTFTLVLDTQAIDDVVIDLTSSNTFEATVSPASITFTSSNWDTPQTVTLTGVDDAADDGDVAYTVNFTVSSVGDDVYNGFTLPVLSASNIDDDASFSFVNKSNVALSTLIVSDSVIVTGVGSLLPISISGGEYAINSGTYTTASGFINENDSVTLRTTSAATELTLVQVVLNIGGSSDTFSVTTDADTDSDGFVNSLDNCTLIANDQLDTNSDGYGNVCDGDFNNDNLVNSLDLGLFRTAFLSTGIQDADMNGDSIVNSLDVGLFRNAFFLPPGPSGVVP